MTEPEPRADGLCVTCGERITARSTYAEPDAFCTSRCCRRHFGCELKVDADVQLSVLAQRNRKERK